MKKMEGKMLYEEAVINAGISAEKTDDLRDVLLSSHYVDDVAGLWFPINDNGTLLLNESLIQQLEPKQNHVDNRNFGNQTIVSGNKNNVNQEFSKKIKRGN